jgi:hemolysin III
MTTMEELLPSPGEEMASAITHAAGAACAVAGAPYLLAASFEQGGTLPAVSAGVFVATAALLYAVSAIYHSVRPGRTKRAFQIADHAAIYLLIAGTYTPFVLGVLRGPWGWGLFSAVWGLAVLGIVQELFASTRPRCPTLLLYLAMGWVALVAIRPIVAHVPLAGLALLLAGGTAYTVGIVFYSIERVRYFHAVWHLFVLAGTAFHFFAVMNYA